MTARRRLAAGAMLIGFPAATCYAWICLTYYEGALAIPSSWLEITELVRLLPQASAISVVLYAMWLLLQVALYSVVPGPIRRGMPLEDETHLMYPMNGWRSFWCTLAILVVAAWSGWLPRSIGYDEFGGLLVVANVTAFVLGASVYLMARRSPGGAATRDPVDDYVMGVSLNPRIRGLDLKFFCESRPGLMLWIALDASCAAKQYELSGMVTMPMLLINAFQFLYVADYFFHEEAILTTWDIRHERFGWMLCWGSLVWVPFMYSIQAQYLVTHPHDLSAGAAAGLVALNLVGYLIFRGANLQKHRFRMNPATAVWRRQPAEYIRTAQGALLLTSGWWGVARHVNYFGDLLMGLAWCLVTGFEHPLPYFYIVYFVILLIHRERRDHRMCLAKYGADWEAYCRKVPWRIVPGLY